MAQFIIGTAGHIDHGKSALVKRLTGMDPDRLSEEQKRGMTIDLGFAFLNNEIAFIDVPGHEKFVKNMVAGVSTVQTALLVIAADDGIMPQTREHLDILRLLNLQSGMIALTKIDLVDDEWQMLVREEIKNLVADSFLANAPIFPVSSTTGQGIDELKQAILDKALHAESRPSRGVFWMPVDRSFSIKGHGTVVTGSVLSGSCQVGDVLELLPEQRQVKVRGLQTHGHAAGQTQIGDRAALNLLNIPKDSIKRGDILATPNYFAPSIIFDVKLRLLKSAPKALKNRTRVRVHLGTREVMARIKLIGNEKLEPGAESFAQIYFEQPAIAMRRDPFVIRRYSPPLTIGGGTILNANAKPVKRFSEKIIEQLKRQEKANPQEMLYDVLQHAQLPLKFTEITNALDLEATSIQKELEKLAHRGMVLAIGKTWTSAENVQHGKEKLLAQIQQFHQKEPLRLGLKTANLQAQTFKQAPEYFKFLLQTLIDENSIVVENGLARLATHEIQLTPEQKKLTEAVLQILQDAAFVTPPVKILANDLNETEAQVETACEILQALGKIIRLEDNIFITAQQLQTAQQKLLTFPTEEISVAEFRELLNTTRKYAVPLLTYFDALGLTERLGDVRYIHKNR